MNQNVVTQRPKLYPPKALLAQRPRLGLSFAGAVRAPDPSTPALSQSELRRIVSEIIG